MERERSIWSQCGLEPWLQQEDIAEPEGWYAAYKEPPPEALMRADREGAYLLTDRSTLLAQVRRGTVTGTTVFVEPVDERDELMNSCFALRSPLVDVDGDDCGTPDDAPSPSKTPSHLSQFLGYLLSGPGQHVIAEFGVKDVGVPLFAPVADGLASTRIVGGRPEGGTWIVP